MLSCHPIHLYIVEPCYTSPEFTWSHPISISYPSHLGHHEKYEPTIFDNYHTHTLYNGEPIALALMDTAGQEDYDHLRPLAYPNTDLFIICFSVVSPHSFENVQSKWYPELQKNCPGVPILLVGTKCDLRENNDVLNILHAKGLQPIGEQQGETMAKLIGAIGYMECSALTGENIKGVFDLAIDGLMKHKVKKQRKKSKSKCVVM